MGIDLLLWHYYRNDWTFDEDITRGPQGSSVFTYEADAGFANSEMKMVAFTIHTFQNGGDGSNNIRESVDFT
jgi:hypothetical protein